MIHLMLIKDGEARPNSVSLCKVIPEMPIRDPVLVTISLSLMGRRTPMPSRELEPRFTTSLPSLIPNLGMAPQLGEIMPRFNIETASSLEKATSWFVQMVMMGTALLAMATMEH